MLGVTRILRAKKGCEDALRQAVTELANHVRASEPRTAAFFVTQDEEDPRIFTIYARFVDRADLAAYDDSWAKAAFAGIAKPLIDGAISHFSGREIAPSAEEAGAFIATEELNAANDE